MIRVLFFGKVADLVGQRELDFAPEVLSLYNLRDQVFEGEAATLKILMSLNREVVRDDRPLKDGDEVAFFSAFSGG